ncbi:MAG: stage II sporulation protein M [Nitrososphaerales archaeon]
MKQTIWNKNRLSLIASFLLLFNIFFFSAVIPISSSEAEDTIKSVRETSPKVPEEKLDQDLPLIERVGSVASNQEYRQFILSVLGRNLLVMGLSSVPFIGIIFASISQFENGRSAAALASAESIPQPVFILILYGAPPFWMELLAFSSIASLSLMMILDRKSWKKEVRKMPKILIISVTLLFLAAIYETFIIASL